MPLIKKENPAMPASPSAPKVYFLAARPKTWIASVSPVLIGTFLAPHVTWHIFFLTLLFSLFIQIGTNFANDYFDFINGADTHLRQGPKRATQEGWISPASMLRATVFIFIGALLIAIPLMIMAGFWSLILASACVAFGLLYTSGPKPLGYLGMGELLVFIFFGPVACCGSYFLQTGFIDMPVFLSSFAPALLSCSILITNNLRDERTDKLANKKTLIVRFGKYFGAVEYTLSIVVAALIPILLVAFYGFEPKLLITSSILLVAIPSIKKVFTFQNPLELIPVLQKSALLLFLYTALFLFTC
jgi:1,4-dihydroxy-2-naphthoate octaprenyltransferase